MAIAARARTSALARRSFLRWNCFPFRAMTNQKLLQSSGVKKVDLRQGPRQAGLPESFLLLQSCCLKPFDCAGLYAGIVAKS